MNFKAGDRVVCVIEPLWDNRYRLEGEMPRVGRTYTVELTSIGKMMNDVACEAVVLRESHVFERNNCQRQCGWTANSFKLIESPPIPTEELPADMLKEALALINLY